MKTYPDYYDEDESFRQDPEERPVTLDIDRSLAAAALGRIKSPAKARAAKENAQKGGRPANPEVQRIMQERGVSRQRAHQILKARATSGQER